MTTYRVEITGTWRYFQDVEAVEPNTAYDIALDNFISQTKPDVTLDFDNLNYNVEKL